MIKLIIFDLDGVLCDCKDLHYNALNKALGSHAISRDEHLSIYDGLNTKEKLRLLTETKALLPSSHIQIFEDKQAETIRLIKEFTFDYKIRSVLQKLKESGFTLCVASNSIRETVKMILLKKGLIEYFDFYLSNQDVKNPKPNPEIYMEAMIKAGVSPKETLIIEDSHIGRKGASESGAFVCPVKDSSEVTYDRILSYCDQKAKPDKWDAGKLNVLIPMAGAGSRFAQAGYTFPKPLIEVKGDPMIKVVVDNLNLKAQFIYIVQKEHYEKYNLQTMLNLITPGCEIIITEGLIGGAACHSLLAKELINNDTPLVIANSDQFIEWDSSEFMYSMTDNIDGGIVTFKSTHPKWSFVKVANGLVTEVAEKNPISDNATVGIYYWKRGNDYVKYAEQMIKADKKVNNEFYICPVFQEAVDDGKKIRTFEVKAMHGLGTPEDLQNFLNL